MIDWPLRNRVSASPLDICLGTEFPSNYRVFAGDCFKDKALRRSHASG
jgi:hypothetical protein